MAHRLLAGKVYSIKLPQRQKEKWLTRDHVSVSALWTHTQVLFWSFLEMMRICKYWNNTKGAKLVIVKWRVVIDNRPCLLCYLKKCDHRQEEKQTEETKIRSCALCDVYSEAFLAGDRFEHWCAVISGGDVKHMVTGVREAMGLLARQGTSFQYQNRYLDLVVWYWDECGNPSRRDPEKVEPI